MKKIAIWGCGRSGTSRLASALENSGFYTGTQNWAKEHESLRLINDTFLERKANAETFRPYGSPELIRRFHASLFGADTRECADFFIAGMNSAAESNKAAGWVAKDPRMILLSEIWRDCFDYNLIVIRRLPESMSSYIKNRWIIGHNNTPPIETAIDYWFIFYDLIERLLIYFTDMLGPGIVKNIRLLEFNDGFDRQALNLSSLLDNHIKLPRERLDRLKIAESIKESQELFAPFQDKIDLSEAVYARIKRRCIRLGIYHEQYQHLPAISWF